MTLLSKDTLSNFLDLIADGASTVEATAGIGAAPGSKIAFKWISDSEAAGEFGPPPAAASPWCVTWRDKLDWFHIHYETARANGRAVRAMRMPPIRRELEERWRAKCEGRPPLVEPSVIEQRLPPEMIIERTRIEPVALDPPAPPKPRPSYALRRAPPLDTTNANGPPGEGRFLVAADRPKSHAQRRVGTVELTDEGVKQW
jgi:hypothetical protein